jgi:hypothetical protein
MPSDASSLELDLVQVSSVNSVVGLLVLVVGDWKKLMEKKKILEDLLQEEVCRCYYK